MKVACCACNVAEIAESIIIRGQPAEARIIHISPWGVVCAWLVVDDNLRSICCWSQWVKTSGNSHDQHINVPRWYSYTTVGALASVRWFGWNICYSPSAASEFIWWRRVRDPCLLQRERRMVLEICAVLLWITESVHYARGYDSILDGLICFRFDIPCKKGVRLYYRCSVDKILYA